MVPHRTVTHLPTPGNSQFATAKTIAPVHPVTDEEASRLRQTCRSFDYKMKMACDDLYTDGFSRAARRRIVDLIEKESAAADAAYERLYFSNPTNP